MLAAILVPEFGAIRTSAHRHDKTTDNADDRVSNAVTYEASEAETAAKPAAHIGQYERMTAYWISIYPEDIDQAKFAAYAKLSKPALEAAGGTFVARGLPELVYEDGKMT